MAFESLYQGSKDIFLNGVRAQFDAVENQALTSVRALQDWSLLGTKSDMKSLFTQVSGITSEGSRTVWRNVGTTGIKDLGTRRAGTPFPEVEFIRTYETAAFNPDVQLAGKITVPDERQNAEANVYKDALNRAEKMLMEINRRDVADIFELFNLAFTIPTSYPTRFFSKGNRGLDGNYTALNEYLISTQHALANGGTSVSNAVTASSKSLAFSDANYYTAKEQGATFTDDVGKPTPRFGGHTTLIVPPANGLVRAAMEINKSEWVVKVNNNEVNVLNGLFNDIKSSPYLMSSYYVASTANTYAWFLVDDTVRDPETGLGFIQVEFHALRTDVVREPLIQSISYLVNEGKSYGWTDWRNILGSKGDAASYTN